MIVVLFWVIDTAEVCYILLFGIETLPSMADKLNLTVCYIRLKSIDDVREDPSLGFIRYQAQNGVPIPVQPIFRLLRISDETGYLYLLVKGASKSTKIQGDWSILDESSSSGQ